MKYLAAIGAFIAALATALFSGQLLGRSKEREKQATKSLKQAKKANEIDDAVRGMSNAQLDKRLRKHQRK